MREIILIRHTRVHNPENICYGQTEIPLAPTFEAESRIVLRRLASLLRGRPPPLVWSSPAGRCRQLAARLFPDRIPVVDGRLREMHFGLWQSRPWRLLPEEERRDWLNDVHHSRTPDGESFADLCHRCRHFVRDLPATPAPMVIISHSGTIRALRVAAGITPAAAALSVQIGYGELLYHRLPVQHFPSE